MDLTARHQHYQALDLIHRPVWIFDIDLRRVYWANTAALRRVGRAVAGGAERARHGSGHVQSVARRLAQYQIDFIDHAAVPSTSSGRCTRTASR
jgi:hypothetical protein